jgi:shikimate kinase
VRDSASPPSVRRVVLVGLMGAGKSTVGPLLAERLGWTFLDLDARIEERAQRSVAEIFRVEGEARFRAWEAECTAELAGSERLVLAPGGGWVTDPENWHRLGTGGTLAVWLQVPVEAALARLADEGANRPLLHVADPAAAVSRLLRGRERLYARAGLHLSTLGRSPSEIAREIESHVRSGFGVSGSTATQR